MLCVLGDCQEIHAQQSAFFGNDITNLDTVPGLLRALVGLNEIAAVAQRYADISVRDGRNFTGRIDGPDIGSYGSQELLNLGIIIGARRSRLLPQKLERQLDNRDGIVNKVDSA